jgi:large subunit ribosomal protein L17
MRHQRAGVHLSRTSSHRKALFSNLVAALITNERIRTTDAKAKETRRLAERTITWARRLGDVLTKKPDRRSPEERARVVHSMRMARRMVRDRHAVLKLFDEIGPRYLARPGGYTRIIKVGQRPGDAAPMSILELIPEDAPVKKVESGSGKGTSGKGATGKSAETAKKEKGGVKAAAGKEAKGTKGKGGEGPAKKSTKSPKKSDDK